MLTRDVRVEEFDASDWMICGEILGRTAPGSGPARGGIVALVEEGRTLKVLSTKAGRLELSALDGGTPLGEAVLRHGASWGVRLDRRALAMLSDRFARESKPSDDPLEQLGRLGVAVRELAEEGMLETYPRDARSLRIPTRHVLERALDALCPVGKTLLLGAFDGPEVATAIALHRGARGIERIVGPAVARTEMGLRSGDWMHDCRGLSRAFELGVGPLSLGCFAQKETFRRLVHDATPGAWTTAVAARKVVFHPVSPGLAIPFGVDVGWAAVVLAKGLASRLGIASFLGPAGPIRPAIERLREAASQGEVERLEPLSILRDLLRSWPGDS